MLFFKHSIDEVERKTIMKHSLSITNIKSRLTLFISDTFNFGDQAHLMLYILNVRYKRKDIPTKTLIEAYIATCIIINMHETTTTSTLKPQQYDSVVKIKSEIEGMLNINTSVTNLVLDNSAYIDSINGSFLFIDDITIEGQPLHSYLDSSMELFIQDSDVEVKTFGLKPNIHTYDLEAYDVLSGKVKNLKTPITISFGVSFHDKYLSHTGFKHMSLIHTYELLELPIVNSTNIDDGFDLILNSQSDVDSLVKIIRKNRLPIINH